MYRLTQAKSSKIAYVFSKEKKIGAKWYNYTLYLGYKANCQK